MSSFLTSMQETLENDCNRSTTENGAEGYRSSGRELLDLNFAVASLRSASEADIASCFLRAFFEEKSLALQWLFFARDVRGGLGERRLFRTVLKTMARQNPGYIRPLVPLVPEYGRWDDLWCLLDTPLKGDVVSLVSRQLGEDQENMAAGKPVSLLAKWMPRLRASSAETRATAVQLQNALDLREREYQHRIAGLSRYLKVLEQQISAGAWEQVSYEQVPSRANLIYGNAFLRHDPERRKAFLDRVAEGEAEIHAGTLFPHDIVHRYFHEYQLGEYQLGARDGTLEALWSHLPDTVGDCGDACGSTVVVADGSGSMAVTVGETGVTALDVANALAIYFAERSSGEFRNHYITFSEHPQLVDLSCGETLHDRLAIALCHDEAANTNIEAVFALILDTAVSHRMKQADLPRNILIISDMEFDQCTVCGTDDAECRPDARLFETIAARYQAAGYRLPRLVFWNVNSRTGTVPVKENPLGVALVSGFSVNVAKMVMSGELDPYQCLLETLQSERYQPVRDALEAAACL